MVIFSGNLNPASGSLKAMSILTNVNAKPMKENLAFEDSSQTRGLGGCRRRNHVRAVFYQFVKPRRRTGGRRKADSHPTQVDFHEPALLAVVLVTLSLCIFDIYATLTLLQKGGIEINPVMRQLIDYDMWWFYVFKYTVTVAGLSVLLSCKNFRLYQNIKALHALYGAVIIYVILAVYQVKLLYDLV